MNYYPGTVQTRDWTSSAPSQANYARGPVAATFNPQDWTPGVSHLLNWSDPSTGAIGKNWPSAQPAPPRKSVSPNVWFVLVLFITVVYLESGKRGSL
jgi:hypothetical protein